MRDRPQKKPQEKPQEKPIDLRAFRWSWTSFMVLATSVPYLVFWLKTPAGHRYSWILPPYPEDSFGYMAWSQQAAHGHVLFRLKYTALPHSAFLFHPFFLVAGWISRLFGCDIGIVHWVLKAVGVVLFFCVFYRYTDYLKLRRWQSILASVLVGISSGVGGLLAFSGLAKQWQIVPADLRLPEVSTYWALSWNPLFPYSLTLIVLIIFWLDRGTSEAHRRGLWFSDLWISGLWFSGFATGVLALIHPYALPWLFAYAVIIAVARRGWDAFGLLLRYFAAAFPLVLYVALVSVLQPLVARHSGRGEMKSPDLVDYLLGFGLPLLICVAGLTVKPGDWVKRYWQLILWFLLSLVFSYLPFWFQRKLIFGAQIPLCILAAICLDLMMNRASWFKGRSWATVVAAIILVALLVSTPLFLFVSEASEVKRDVYGTYYVSDGVRDGLNFLKEKTRPDEVVFASWEASRMIPAYAGNTVLWGHWAMSVDLEERKQWDAHLFGENSNWQDPQRSSDFWGAGVEYIFADDGMKESMAQYPEVWRVMLNDADKVFDNGSVVIYKHRTGRP
jgi:hypothetical protein